MYKTFPTSTQLIEDLDKRFPEQSPDPKDSEREVWMKAGERRLIRHLKKLYEDKFVGLR